MQRSLARKLIGLLLLLALVAGGDRFARMTIDMDMNAAQMSDMQKPDMSCKACDGAIVGAPCDAVCVALPAIEAASIDLSVRGFHERWVMRSDAGATFSMKPDTSPPRA